MIFIILGLVIILFFISIAWYLKASLFSPLVLNSIGWLIAFLSGTFFHNEYYPITEDVFIAWFIWFCISSVIFTMLLPPAKGWRYTLDKLNKYKVSFGYQWLVVMLSFWLAWEIWIVGSTGPEHFFLNLRLASNGLDGFGSLGLVARLYPVVFALFIIEWILLSKNRNKIRLLLLFWMLLYAIGTMGKFTFLTPILIIAFSLSLHNKIPLHKMMVFGGASLIVMIALHFIRSGSFTVKDLGQFISVYTYSPIVALGYLENNESMIFGENTFRFYYAVAHSLGQSMPPAEVILDYVEIPELTNVYTGLFPYYYDFGMVGIVLFSLIIGLLFGLLYYTAGRGGLLALFSYGALIVCLLSMFFNDLFFAGVSGHLQVIIIICIIVFLGLRKEHD